MATAKKRTTRKKTAMTFSDHLERIKSAKQECDNLASCRLLDARSASVALLWEIIFDGGTEIQAVDFIVAKKVLRKFESLSLGFMKDELTKFSNYLDKLFGKNTMVVCKEYIDMLKKNN